MSETVKKPVFLDETAQRIVEELKALTVREGSTREVLLEIRDILNEKLSISATGAESELFIVPFKVTITATEGDNLAKTANCELDGITFADVEKAYADGKLLIADITETTTGKRGFVPLSMIMDSETTSGYYFDGSGKNNALGRPFCITINNMKAANKQFISCGIYRIRSEDIACNVTIGGTTYTTLAEALTALAASG